MKKILYNGALPIPWWVEKVFCCKYCETRWLIAKQDWDKEQITLNYMVKPTTATSDCPTCGAPTLITQE